jgi:hypothetical protein
MIWYEGVADINHDGRGEVLVFSTASGCCRPYPNAYESYVIRWLEGRLQLLTQHGEAFALGEDSGRGDAFTGWTCTGAHPVITTALLRSYTRADVRRTTVFIDGRVVHTRTSVAHDMSITRAQEAAYSRVDCPPLNQEGFDPADPHPLG